ncbi:MAG: helix-turn-helix transcriptional regulator [Clostridia bacterium]|nr:helix-turn-helix transcriptional regulator [Clostridia bacterium]
MKIEQIDLVATGENIKRLRVKNGITVAQIQEWLGLSSPRIIYKWQRGERLPSVENLIALSKMFNTIVNDIVIFK